MKKSMILLIVKILGLLVFSKTVFHDVNAQSDTQNETSSLFATADQLQEDLSAKLKTVLDQAMNQINSLSNSSLDNKDDIKSNLKKAISPLLNGTQELLDVYQSDISKIKKKAISDLNNALDEAGITDSKVRDFLINGISKLLNITQKLTDGLQAAIPKLKNKGTSFIEKLLDNASNASGFASQTFGVIKTIIPEIEIGVTGLLNETAKNMHGITANVQDLIQTAPTAILNKTQENDK